MTALLYRKFVLDDEKRQTLSGGISIRRFGRDCPQFRKNDTNAEAVWWEILRNRRFMELKFRRQHQFGPYITDFYCAELGLAIECDGGVHLTRESEVHDHKRDAFLRARGLHVHRIPNDALEDIGEALEKLRTLRA